MNLWKRSTPFVIIACLLLFAATVTADSRALSATCVYNADLGQIEYSVTGGLGGATYTAHMTANGCVDLTGAPPDLSGPADAQVVGVTCTSSSSTGSIYVEICEGPICFESFNLRFACNDVCEIIPLQGAVPSTGPLGLAILILTLIGAGLVLTQRRTA